MNVDGKREYPGCTHCGRDMSLMHVYPSGHENWFCGWDGYQFTSDATGSRFES